jgi:hypothetical protein
MARPSGSMSPRYQTMPRAGPWPVTSTASVGTWCREGISSAPDHQPHLVRGDGLEGAYCRPVRVTVFHHHDVWPVTDAGGG